MLIDLDHARRVYAMGMNQVVALKDVSLRVRRGEFVSIMGPSGSGKSTLMHILGCLDRPTAGRYLLDGTPVEGMPDLDLSRLRNRKVGFVFQSFNLISQMTILENVELPLVYGGTVREERMRRAQEMLAAVGLANRANHRSTELSGGECQRAAIARALVNAPPLVLADEPTGNLDTRTGLEIMKIFKRLHQNGTTIVIVTHDSEVTKWSKRVIRMRDGTIEKDSGARAPAPPQAAASQGWREEA